MEISLTKKHLKNALALLMAFLIAMSTMWTGLSVVTFAVDGESNVTSGNVTGGNVTGGIVIGGNVTGGNVDAPSGAVIKSGKCGSNVTFDLYENGVLVISGSGSMYNYYYSSSDNPFYSIRSKITSVIIENGVTSVGNHSFYYNYDKIKTVVISDSVKMIGNHAFYGCDALESVFIGNGVTSIGSYAFYGCYNINNVYATDIESWMKILFAGDYDSRWTSRIYSNPLCYGANLYFDNELATEVVIPEGATLIKKCTFYNCDSIKKVTIPETVTEIDDYAFYSCNKLQNITLPKSLVTIGNKAFYNCDNFTQVVIPDNVKTVGNYAYAGCDSLTDIKIGKGITRINTWTFAQCDSLETVTVPSNIKKIARGAFYDCDSLKSIVIPDTVTGLGTSAFRGCGKLDDVTLSKNLKAIRAYLFYNCDSLETITIPESVETIEKVAFRGCDNLENVTIPESVTSIGAKAFMNCDSLKTVTIPDGVSYLGYSAFENCKSLEDVTLGNGITYIHSGSFSNCDSLTKIVIPDSVTSINGSAFSYCDSLTEVTIGDSVKSIGSYAFYGCYSLESVYASDAKSWLNIKFNDYDANPLNSRADLYFNGELVTDLVVPDSVTSIGSYAFYGCDSLTEVTIPDSVTTIGSYAFRYCDSLTEVTIPDSVTSIGSDAFYGCNSLESIRIPDNVTSISDSAFSRLTIHCNKNSVAEAYAKKKCYPYVLLDGGDEVNIVGGNIGKNFTWTLDKRTGLLEISGGGKLPYFTDESPAPWEAYGDYITQVKLPDGLLVISNKSFENLKRVKNITIPDSVTIIDSNAFYNCKKLKSVTIGDSVTTIGDSAFCNCNSLESVTIGNSVTTIGSDAFYDCDSLTEVTIGDSVTTIGSDAFYGCDSIESVYASDAESWLKIGFAYNSNPLFNGADLYFDGKLVTELVVPENITEIKSYAFHNYNRLDKVSFNLDENYESKARTISYDAFTGCSGLREIILPASVNYIYSDAFPATLEKITILNPECEINSSCGITYNSEVVGFKGSTAEAFADEKAAYFTYYETIHTHSYKVISDTKATCTQAGLFLERCSCGKENKEIREATGHDFKDFEVTLEPTCTSYGQRKAFCKNCDYYESQRIEPTYHENRENRDQQNPTCTSYGYTSGVYCPDCDIWLSGHALINPTSHAYTEKIIDDAHLVSEATAISPAVYRYDCVNCDSIGEETFTHGEASGLGKTSKITATQSTSAIKLTWKPVEEASGYIIFTWFDSSWEAVAITNATTHKFTGLPSGTKYKFAVLAYGNTNMGMLVLANNYTTISTATEADLPSSIKASQTTSTVTLKWSACEGATGYRVYQYSPSKGKYVQIASVKTTSYKKAGLKAGTDYKFKIKPYVKLDDGTVIWSEATDAFKTATKPATVTVKVSSTAAGKASLSWNAVTGADGYRVYYKTSGGSYKLLKTVGSSTKSLTVTGLKSGTKYAFYVKAGIKTDSGTIYGAYKAASVTVK